MGLWLERSGYPLDKVFDYPILEGLENCNHIVRKSNLLLYFKNLHRSVHRLLKSTLPDDLSSIMLLIREWKCYICSQFVKLLQINLIKSFQQFWLQEPRVHHSYSWCRQTAFTKGNLVFSTPKYDEFPSPFSLAKQLQLFTLYISKASSHSVVHFHEGWSSPKASGNVLCRKIGKAIFGLFSSLYLTDT